MNLIYKQFISSVYVILIITPCIFSHVIHVMSGCPVGRYQAANGKCKLCYSFCGHEGCSGQGNHLGTGGCSSCWLAEETQFGRIECISPFHGCRQGLYSHRTESNLFGHIHTRAICRKCHQLCVTCTGPSNSECQTCKHFRIENYCVRECPPGSIIHMREKRCTFLNESMRDRIMRNYSR